MHNQAKRTLMFVSFTFATAFACVGCGGGADLGACPTDSAALQSAGETVVATRCATAGCHTSQNGGNPAEGLDFSSASVVKSEAATMYDEASRGSMPPSGMLSDTDIEALQAYLACLP